MGEQEKELLFKIEKIIDEKISNYLNRLTKESTTEINNENGTASILKSGNSIVYIDNSGIAYAMLLFFYQMMSEKEQKGINIDDLLGKIEERMSKNRRGFEELLSSINDKEKWLSIL